jgi:hypothetical protein
MTRTLLLLGLAALSPAAALAQQAPPSSAPPGATAPAAGDRAARTYDEVERGFSIGVQAGPTLLLNAPAAEGTPRPQSSGQTAQLELAVDIGEVLRLGVFVQGTTQRAGSEYQGFSGGTASGDFSALIPGASLRVMALGFQDAQEVKRTWLYLRGGAGYALFAPRQLLPTPDILVFAGPGLEYYTRLRHFSVGIEVTGTYLLSSRAVGFQLTPSLRYAF